MSDSKYSKRSQKRRYENRGSTGEIWETPKGFSIMWPWMSTVGGSGVVVDGWSIPLQIMALLLLAYRLMTCTSCLWGPCPDWHKEMWLGKCTIIPKGFSWALDYFAFLFHKSFLCHYRWILPVFPPCQKMNMGMMKMKQSNINQLYQNGWCGTVKIKLFYNL